MADRNIEADFARAAALVEAGRPAQALPLLRACIHARPDDPPLHFALGVALLALRDLEAAAAAFGEAARRQPGHVDALANRAAALAELGRTGEALTVFSEALSHAPRDADLLCNTALAAIESGDPDRAEGLLARVEQPDARVEALRGIAAVKRDDPERAESCFRAALARDPADVQNAMGLSAALEAMGRASEAIDLWTAWIARVPGNRRARFEVARLLLAEGRNAEAMPHFRERPAREGRPLPEASMLRGGRILIEAEQGIGDEIFYLRWLPSLRANFEPAEIGYRASPAFASLARGVPGIDTHWNGPPDAWPGPRVMASDLMVLAGGAPAPALRLEPQAAAVDAARRRLSAGRPPYLGVAWEGGTRVANRAERMRAGEVLHKRIDPDRLGAALSGWPGSVVVLQRDPVAEDLASFERESGKRSIDLSDLQRDLPVLLAALSLLDDYAGVSTTNIHLLAAAGGRARVLVPQHPDWRWLARGDESPWFHGFTIYRRSRGTGWTDALRRLRGDLRLG